jgi:hypothetical protein
MGMEQYANSKTAETDPNAVLTELAGERVRVAYQLCKHVQADLANPEIQFQKGRLLHLRDATQELALQLFGKRTLTLVIVINQESGGDPHRQHTSSNKIRKPAPDRTPSVVSSERPRLQRKAHIGGVNRGIGATFAGDLIRRFYGFRSHLFSSALPGVCSDRGNHTQGSVQGKELKADILPQIVGLSNPKPAGAAQKISLPISPCKLRR